MVDYSAMSGPELVRSYNEMAQSEHGKELGARPVNRFTDLIAGRRRCEALESSIRARTNGLAQETETEPEKEVEQTTIFAEFKTNTKKNRGKLLRALANNLNQQVPINKLMRAVYGTHLEDSHAGALKMVLRGLQQSIDKSRLPYTLMKTREEGVLSYGLHTKTQNQ